VTVESATTLSTTTASDGSYSFASVVVGTHAVSASATGYTSSTREGVIVTGGANTALDPLRLSPATGSISGTLINAFTNAAIAGATVTATPSPSGMATEAIDIAPISATTASNGHFVIANVPAGIYDVTTDVAGFISATRTGIVVAAGLDVALGTLSSSPVTSAGNIRIVLDWGACSANSPSGPAPCDLDSHLTGPRSNGTRFHVYYAAPSFSDLASHASLDVDDVSGLGPETITLSLQSAGVYHYYVHDYSQYCCGGPVMTNSAARVRVFFGSSSTPAATYSVPLTGSGALWDVFTLDGTTLTQVSVIRTVPNPSSVGAASLSRIPLASATTSTTGTIDQELQRIADDLARSVKAPQ
jgi:hypothetical protein